MTTLDMSISIDGRIHEGSGRQGLLAGLDAIGDEVGSAPERGHIALSDHICTLNEVALDAPGSLERLMDRFGDLVWSITRKYCPNHNDAEDAVQDIFIEIWKSAHRFDPGVSKESTFVAMIARRRMIDRLRRSTRRIQTVSVEDQENQVPEGPGNEPLEAKERINETNKAFMKLRPEQRQVLELSIHHGRSHEEIAATTGLPLGTVKTHARRGLMRLRDLLSSNVQGAAESSDLVGGVS